MTDNFGAQQKRVRVREIPTGEYHILRESSYFTTSAGKVRGPRDEFECTLPSPGDIRAKNREIDENFALYARPPVVRFEEEGLIVKYGRDVSVAEAQCLWYFNQHMRDEVPTPELFGWTSDCGETFIYMELIRGDTLEERWPSMSEVDKRSICNDLRRCVTAWRSLRQETDQFYVGNIIGQGLGDIIFANEGCPYPGPFDNVAEFHEYFVRVTRLKFAPEWDRRRLSPELDGLTDDRPIVFTHGDLFKSNITITPRREGFPARVAAIIDWHQSGWYPADWEWLKAQWGCEYTASGGRQTAWLEHFMTPVDKEYDKAWECATRWAI